MPSFRKLSATEAAALDDSPVGARAEIMHTYDVYLADFVVGDYGRAEVLGDERRAVVRRRLQAAAGRRSLVLRFRLGPGPLTFQVAAAPAISTPAPQEQSATTPVPPATLDRRSPRPPQPSRQRKSAAERYRDVLPRWMRDGQHAGRKNGTTKRRSR